MKQVLSKVIGMAAVVVSVVAAVLVAAPATAATPDWSDFDAGYIISDYAMYNDSAMTEAEIQAFLEAQSGTCANTRCLDILRVDTSDKSASTTCSAYTGADGELVSRIIYRLQGLCDVSAKVLLVTLQKEQGLVTSTAPSSTAIQIATGYGCPDTSACNSKYYGIDNQLYWAARAYGWYRVNPYDGTEVGAESIYYHPRSNPSYQNPPTCSSKSVNVQNEATAALYNYTPYTPNAAALAAGWGTGDSCSSYGNRNFWAYYVSWFGSPTTLVPSGVETTRFAGSNRYETAVMLSQDAYPDGSSTVFISGGLHYADALSAGPVAAAVDAPLLLVSPDSIPGTVQAELERLAPDRIVIAGGVDRVGEAVMAALSGYAPEVERVAGDDRYETSRLLVESAFGESGAPLVFVANGENYPDALTAGAAAGSLGAPVLLLPGYSDELSPEAEELLVALGTTDVRIAGGLPSVSAGTEADLAAVAGVTAVTRYAGSDRYETSELINRAVFDSLDSAYIATGANYPDALAASAVAAAAGAPVVLSSRVCVRTGSLEHLVDSGLSRVVIVGGTPSLASSVAEYQTCG